MKYYLEDVAPFAPLENRFYEAGHIQTAKHLDIVVRFGRFPHRNAILGRTTTAEEARYLERNDVAPFWPYEENGSHKQQKGMAWVSAEGPLCAISSHSAEVRFAPEAVTRATTEMGVFLDRSFAIRCSAGVRSAPAPNR